MTVSLPQAVVRRALWFPNLSGEVICPKGTRPNDGPKILGSYRRSLISTD
jgi:hypothetical protein